MVPDKLGYKQATLLLGVDDFEEEVSWVNRMLGPLLILSVKSNTRSTHTTITNIPPVQVTHTHTLHIYVNVLCSVVELCVTVVLCYYMLQYVAMVFYCNVSL